MQSKPQTLSDLLSNFFRISTNGVHRSHLSDGACVAGRILSGSTPCTSLSHLALLSSSSTTTRERNLHLVSAKKESSSRSRKDLPDTTITTYAAATTEEEWRRQKNAEIEEYFRNADYLPELPGTKPDFFEGPQWDTFASSSSISGFLALL
ncbi:hypothetical protein SESBI_25602 [Sesbania bispinosa]|nr:hypothetical protein SESBI_25602 [Sesbania bispinosa]